MKFITILTLLLIVVRIDLFSVCVGCGGQKGGNQPCFNAGEIISEGGWYSLGWYCYEIDTYIGNCQIQQDFYRNSILYSTYVIDGGCYCGELMPAYNEITYPLTSWELTTNGIDQFAVNTEIPLIKIEVWELKENGDLIFSIDDSTAANQIIEIPIPVFQNGQDYIIIGYDLLNNTSTYMSIRKVVNDVKELKIFCSWGVPDSTDTQRRCVTYVGNDSVMVFIQHLDKSGQIIKGSTNVVVGINQKELIDGNAMELFQNHPNPFYPSTTIDFTIQKCSNVRLVIYDIQGREIEQLVNDYLVPSEYHFIWDASRYLSGTFYYQLTSDFAVKTKKMILLK